MSPASSFPYDILLEIFIHCLPDSPLNELQPNTKIAPSLLCCVCCSWRTVALENSRLWTYLYYRLPIHWPDGQPIAWDLSLFPRTMECLTWWRANQGSKASFIRIVFYMDSQGTGMFQALPLTTVNMQFFADYMSSAQYLDVGPFALYVFQQNVNHALRMLPYFVPFPIAPTL